MCKVTHCNVVIDVVYWVDEGYLDHNHLATPHSVGSVVGFVADLNYYSQMVKNALENDDLFPIVYVLDAFNLMSDALDIIDYG